MSTHTVAPPRDGATAVRSDLRHLDTVRGIFASLARFVNAQAIYQSNNPHFITAAASFEQSFRSFFQSEPELVLTVLQYRILWREQVVYDVGCNTESIAFLLFKDGIGEVSFQASVSRPELEQFAGIVKGALYNPSAQFDTATALWQAEFAGISYRVLDEQSDSPSTEGDGSGSSSHEQPLRATDHEELPVAPAASKQASDAALGTLADHFNAGPVAQADQADREARLVQAFREQVAIGADELAAWTRGARAGEDGDELLVFLRGMIEFTRMRFSPPVIRDVNDTIERLIHYIHDEGNIATLTETLEIVAGLDRGGLEPGFAALPDRIETELTHADYLVSLARGLRSANDPHDVLRYFGLVGSDAAPAVCELLAHSGDHAVHEKACDVLAGCAGPALHTLVDAFDVENPLLAADAVRLYLRGSIAPDVPAVIHRILASRDPEIRRCAIDYLVRVRTDEAARLLCGLFNEPDASVRMRAFSAVDRSAHASIIETLIAICFGDDAVPRSTDELEMMFRALGKAAGVAALAPIRQSINKKHYLARGKARGRRDKLVALTALRFIPGEDTRDLIDTLTRDADQLVRTKAQHVLKQRETGTGSDVDYPAVSPDRPGGEPR